MSLPEIEHAMDAVDTSVRAVRVTSFVIAFGMFGSLPVVETHGGDTT